MNLISLDLLDSVSGVTQTDRTKCRAVKLRRDALSSTTSCLVGSDK
jgi:hypothetical protein